MTTPRDRKELSRVESEMLLIRVALGLNPGHSVLAAVRVLHDEGREAFERLRGERCEWAHEWKPLPDPQP